jgi:hypothetical protein
MLGVLLAELPILPCRRGWVFWLRGGMLEVARGCFPADSLRGARPGCELAAQHTDILVAEPVPGELLVGYAIELPAGIGEVLRGQARIEVAGEADQLRRAVTVKHPRGVGVVAHLDAAGERAYLAACYVFQRPPKRQPITST